LIAQLITIWIFCLGFACIVGTIHGTPMGNVKKTNKWLFTNFRKFICWILKMVHDIIKPGGKKKNP